MSMGIDWIGFLLAVAFIGMVFIFWRRNVQKALPAIYFSETSGLQKITPSRRVRWNYAPEALRWLAFACLLTALVDPYYTTSLMIPLDHPDNLPPTEGIGIYLVLDQSGSMDEKILVRDPSTGRQSQTTKLKLLKSVTEQFIQEKPNDLIGLITFARSAQVLSPLTLDHHELLKRLKALDIMRMKEQDGTSIGYAIFKTAHLIAATRHFAEELLSEGKPAYTIKNVVIILVTDGAQDPNPLDRGKEWRTISIERAVKYAISQGIKVYIVNVDPKFSSEKYVATRRQMERLASSSGGGFFLVNDSQNLSEIYNQISQLEKSVLPFQDQEKFLKSREERCYSAFILLILAAGALFAALFLECMWLKKVP